MVLRRRDEERTFPGAEPPLPLWHLPPAAHLSILVCSCTQWLISSENSRRLGGSKIGQIKPEGHKPFNIHLSQGLSLVHGMEMWSDNVTQTADLEGPNNCFLAMCKMPSTEPNRLPYFIYRASSSSFCLCNESAKSYVPYLKLQGKSI